MFEISIFDSKGMKILVQKKIISFFSFAGKEARKKELKKVYISIKSFNPLTIGAVRKILTRLSEFKSFL